MINIIEIIDSLKDDKDVFTVTDEKLKLNLFSFYLVPKIRDLFLELNKDISDQLSYAINTSSLWLNPQPRNKYKNCITSVTPFGGFLKTFASVGYRPERKRDKLYKGLKKSDNTFFSLPYFEIELFIANAKIGIGLSFFRQQELSIFKKYIKKYNNLVVGAMEWAGVYRYPTYTDVVLPIDFLSDLKEVVHFITLPISIDSFDLLKFNQFKNIYIALFAIYYDILIAAETGKIKSYGIECFNNFYEKNLFQEFAGYERIDEIKQDENKVTTKTVDFFSHIQSGIRYRVLARDSFKCIACGRTPINDGIILHVDHIIPKSKGGTDSLDNLQALCSNCNLGKSNKDNTDIKKKVNKI